MKIKSLLVTGAVAAAMTPMFAASAEAATAPVAQAAPAVQAVNAVAVADADVPKIAKMPCISTRGSKACFKAKGDKIYVLDTKKDGYRAVSSWYTSYGRKGTCHNPLGKGKWGVCNYNMKEGKEIWWLATRADGETQKEIFPRSGLLKARI